MVYEHSHTLLPNDESVIKILEHSVGPRTSDEESRESPYPTRKLVQVFKDNCCMGIRKGQHLSEFWAQFIDGSRCLFEMTSKGATLSYSIPEGLTVKSFPSGSVLQQLTVSRMKLREKWSRAYSDVPEQSRAITHSGSVIRYFKSGRIQILLPDGNIAEYSNNEWVSTNNKGLQKSRNLKTNEENELPAVSCTLVTDPLTKSRVLVREDEVTRITYADGSVVVEYADGTKIYTNSDCTERTIEGIGYAPVRIFLNEQFEVYLPDDSWATVSGEEVVLYRHDRGVLQLNVLQGVVKVLTGKEAREMELLALERETAFQNTQGVYTANLPQGKIHIIDDLDNVFEVFQNGSFKHTPPEATPAEGSAVKVPPPRLFVILNSGEGLELLNELQIDEYLTGLPSTARAKQFEFSHFKLNSFLVANESPLLSYGLLPNSPLRNYPIPQVLQEICQEKSYSLSPAQLFYRARALIQYSAFTAEAREELKSYQQDFQDWKHLQLTKHFEFGVEDSRDEKTAQKDFAIKSQVIQSRRNPNTGETLAAEPFYDAVTAQLVRAYQEEAEENMMAEQDTSLECTFSELSVSSQSLQHTEGKRYRARRPLTYRPDTKHIHNNSSFFNYFQSQEGAAFLEENPVQPKAPSQHALHLPEVDPGGLSQEEAQHFAAMKETLSQSPSMPTINLPEIPEKSDNPYVTLEYEAKHLLSKKPRQVILKPVNSPSCFTEVEKLQQLKQDAEQEAADEYIYLKTKEFDVYGAPRAVRPTVHSIRTTSLDRAPNEKHILTESATDRRNKISSQSLRPHTLAPSVQSMRKEGTHDVLSRALLKKQTYKEMIETQNMMISAYTVDPLKRNMQIIPATARFGVIQAGETYSIMVLLRNEDNLTQRYTLRQPEEHEVKVVFKPEPIAPGMARTLSVEIQPIAPRLIETSFQIATKAEIFTIPVYANVTSEEEFQRINEESWRLNKRGVLKPTVKLRGDNSAGETQKWAESGVSELHLPSEPSLYQDFQVDPQRSLDEVIKSYND